MIWLTLALASEASFGKEPTERVLGGHDYGQPVAVEPAFLSSYVSFRQGVGLLVLNDARYPGIPEPLALQLLGLTEVLRGQVALSDRVAVGVMGSGTLLSGADSDSALFLGARGAYEVRLNGHVGLVRSERVQLTGRLGMRRSYELRVTPADLAVELLDETQQALAKVLRGRWANSLLGSTHTWQGTGGLSAAWTLSDDVGLMGSLSARAGRTWVAKDADAAGTGVQLGAGVAVDVRPTKDEVLGLQLGIQDAVDRTAGLEDEVPGRHRMVIPLQIYADLGSFQLGLVPSMSLSWGSEVSERQGGIEGRAVGYF